MISGDDGCTRHLTTGQLLDRLTHHLDMLAGKVFDLERSVGDLLPRSDLTTGSSIQQLQALDFVRQSLEDLAVLTAFGARNGADLPRHGIGIAAAAEKMRLDSTREMLISDPDGLSPDRISSGEVDLF